MAFIWDNFLWFLGFFFVIFCLWRNICSLAKDWCEKVDQKRLEKLRTACSKCGSSNIGKFSKEFRSPTYASQVEVIRHFPYIRCRDYGKEKALEENQTMGNIDFIMGMVTLVLFWLFYYSLSKGIPQQFLAGLLEK